MAGSISRRRLETSVGGVLAGLLLLGMTGCGGGNPYKQIPVSGKVTYEDGSLIKAERIRLRFISQAKPVDKATNPRPGEADVQPHDGTFAEATTMKYGDGLIAGKHSVKLIISDANDKETELKVDPAEIEVSGDKTTFEFKAKKGK